MKVYEVQGWFGDHEWSEGLYASEDAAQTECNRLWAERRSEHAPDWCQGLCKFCVEEREVA